MTGEWTFEDSNLDLFLIYDFRQTQTYWGCPDPTFDYEHQFKVPRHKRKKIWPTEDEFWAGTEPVEFRVRGSKLADYRKFRKWVYAEIENRRNEKSY